MRFRLRTLLLVLAFAPPILATIGIAAFGLKNEPTRAEGIVTYRGTPVALGTVSFLPHHVRLTTDQLQHEARTDEQGRFRMDRDAIGKPLQGREYTVVIVWSAKGKKCRALLTTALRSSSVNDLRFELH